VSKGEYIRTQRVSTQGCQRASTQGFSGVSTQGSSGISTQERQGEYMYTGELRVEYTHGLSGGEYVMVRQVALLRRVVRALPVEIALRG
jgi:hypothetical protein